MPGCVAKRAVELKQPLNNTLFPLPLLSLQHGVEARCRALMAAIEDVMGFLAGEGDRKSVV